MANVATVQEVTMVHSPGKEFEKVDGEIRVPITSVRVWEKTGWKVKDSDEAKQADKVKAGKASPARASVQPTTPDGSEKTD